MTSEGIAVSEAVGFDHGEGWRTRETLFSIESGSADEPALETTLLDLIAAVDEASESEEEVLATVAFMLASRRLRLAPEQSYREECG
jgi:hypothetical protein